MFIRVKESVQKTKHMFMSSKLCHVLWILKIIKHECMYILPVFDLIHNFNRNTYSDLQVNWQPLKDSFGHLWQWQFLTQNQFLHPQEQPRYCGQHHRHIWFDRCTSFWTCCSCIHVSLGGRSLEDATEVNAEDSDPDEQH